MSEEPFNVKWEPLNQLWRGIPYYMRTGLDLWIMRGVTPGDFLSAVLKNDLMRALKYADEMNASRLFQYGSFLYNVAPANCYGSPAKFYEWADLGGIEGIEENSNEGDDN